MTDYESEALRFWQEGSTHPRGIPGAIADAIEAAEKRGRDMERERRFPIQGGPSLPWRLVTPYEAQALRNHSQTLEGLARRQGLSPAELKCLMQNRDLFPHPTPEEGLAFLHMVIREDDYKRGRVAGLREAEQQDAEAARNGWPEMGAAYSGSAAMHAARADEVEHS